MSHDSQTNHTHMKKRAVHTKSPVASSKSNFWDMNESCHMYDWVRSLIWMIGWDMSQTCPWIIPHMWMSHVTGDVSVAPATHCNTLQHTATHCNTLQHAATHYVTLQHAGSCEWVMSQVLLCNRHTATRCNTLQHAATRCNTLQHAATRYVTLQHAASCEWVMSRVLLSNRHTATHCNTLTRVSESCHRCYC